MQDGIERDAPERVHIAEAEVRRYVARIFAAEGVPEPDAEVAARCLVGADLRGVDTHGVLRLPGYVDRIRRGLVNRRPALRPERVAPAAALLDGEDGLGFVVATRAMREAIAIAGETGLGLVSVRRSTHFGMAASYLLQATQVGFIGFVFTNASPAMPPWGGREPLLGTSPFAVGAPGGEGGDFILDMAPSVAARGKIRRALREGRPIPEGWALDEEGRPTTDPEAALRGVVLPMGGPKGYGLSMLMDILGGVLSGAAFGGEVGDQYKRFDRPQNVGHFVMALRPGLFVGQEAYRARMEALVSRVRSAPRAEGVEEIMIPGEPEARMEARRRREGIPYRSVDLDPLFELSDAIGVARPAMSPAPLDQS